MKKYARKSPNLSDVINDLPQVSVLVVLSFGVLHDDVLLQPGLLVS